MLVLVHDRVGEKRPLMAWVRYDDQFHHNRKVTAVVAEDAGAIGLHTLANTWTNSQKQHKGFVPTHQPGILVCDKTQGREWAALLVKHGLWHEVASMCPDCKEEYEDLPAELAGFVFHNAEEYRAAGRDRTTPGTSADLSEKRRAAGRKGGLASAKKRDEDKQKQAKPATGQANEANEANAGGPERGQPSSKNQGGSGDVLVGHDFARPAEMQQTAEANQANSVSKDSNLLLAGVSPVPVPVPSDEPTVHHDTSDGDAADESDEGSEERRDDIERVCKHLADRIQGNGSKRPRITKTWRNAARLLMDTDGRTEDQVHRAIDWCQGNSFWRRNVMSMPKLREQYDRLRLQAEEERERDSRTPTGPRLVRSTTDERVAQAQALKERRRARAAGDPVDETPMPEKTIVGEVVR